MRLLGFAGALGYLMSRLNDYPHFAFAQIPYAMSLIFAELSDIAYRQQEHSLFLLLLIAWYKYTTIIYICQILFI